MNLKENFSGNFSNKAPERMKKIINPGASKTSAIEDLKKIGMKNNLRKVKKK